MQNNGCFACHAIASKKTAPAFAGIGKRNKRFEGDHAKANIMNSIKNGSHGRYPYFANKNSMPDYPNFSESELSTLADYILAQSFKAKAAHGGMMGQGGKRQGMGGWGF